MKNDPREQFIPHPDIFEGMDGSPEKLIPNVLEFKEILEPIVDSASCAVDIAIACAMIDAESYQDGKNGDVSAHLDYIIKELTKFKNNLDS